MQGSRLFESWNLAKPVLPGRSQLYALTPIGIGTPFVESLTGYVSRLAAVHTVSVGDLVGRVLARFAPADSPIISERARRGRGAASGFEPGSHTINGVRENAARWLHALEATTSRSDLRFLTLLPFREILPDHKSLFRTVQAWCPQCLHKRDHEGKVAYLPLLWNLRLVTICALDSQPLVEICPYCSRSFGPLLAKSRPGYCGHCQRWLGAASCPIAQQADRSRADTDYAGWLAYALGELVAAAPELAPGSLKNALRKNLARCVDQLAGGNRAALRESVRCSDSVLGAWLSGRNLPRIDSLLRTCYHLRVSAPQLLRDLPADWKLNFPVTESSMRRRNCYSRQPHTEKVCQALLAALHEEPPPSVAEIARRFGYQNGSFLWKLDAECCKQISANYRKAGSPNRWRVHGSKRICEANQIEEALKASLAEATPSSIPKIAASLGYASATSLRQKFPELCSANIAKRAESRKRRRKAIKATLREALGEKPAPTLKDVSHRLGFGNETVLRDKFPELCNTLLARRKTWETENRERIRADIRTFLDETENSGLATVCGRFGFSQSHLLKRFPDLYREITVAYWQGFRARSAKRREMLQQEVLQIVPQLIRQGNAPTLERVLPLLSNDSVRDWNLVRGAIGEAKRRLGCLSLAPFPRARRRVPDLKFSEPCHRI